MNVPSELIIGDTWSWDESLPNYPASTWTMTFYFVNSAAAFSVVASASGDDYAVSVNATITDGRTAGRYRWSARVTDGTDVHTLAQGWTDVLANVTAAQDARSSARRTLDAVEATLEGRATRDDLNTAINGRSISRIPISELLQWRDRLKEEARAQEEGENAGLGRDIRVRFRRA